MSWTSGPSGGNNLFNGGTANDTADGLSGNDTLYGAEGDDSLVGDLGSDSLVGDIGSEAPPGKDTLVGGDGTDTLFGGADADSIVGGNDADSLSEATAAVSGNDTYDFGGGNDLMVSGSQNDRDSIMSGEGNDTVYLNYNSHTGGAGSTLDGGIGDDSIRTAINAAGSTFNRANFSLVGGDGSDSIIGWLGNDSIDGGDGNDLVDAGGGNDVIGISGGGDSLMGAAGDDLFRFSGVFTQATIDGGSGNDTLNLGDPADWSSSLNATTGVTTYTFTAAGAAAGSTLAIRNVESILCYAVGTRIATPRGEIPIERLSVGDLVLSAGTLASVQPILWIGTIHAELARHPNPERARPVLIRAGALGEGTPTRDLRVSPDHGMFMDGVLVPAKLLVNGASIVQEAWWPSITYMHIELPEHAIILAEGAPAESWLDDGRRSEFDNAGLAAQFVDFGLEQAAARPAGAFPVLHDAAAAAVFCERFARLVRARTRLTNEPDARLILAHTVIPGSGVSPGRLRFHLAAMDAENARRHGASLASRIAATSADARAMRGLAIAGFELRAGSRERSIHVGDAMLRDLRGLGIAESHAGVARLWTDGQARLPANLFAGLPSGPLELDVLLAEQGVFWAAA